MSGDSLTSSGEQLEAYFTGFAQMAQAREVQNGNPIENCPTAAEMWDLVERFRHLGSLSDPVAVGEVNQLMRSLAELSDKWVDPENDPIGSQIQGQIEVLIDDLVQLIGQTLPDAAEPLGQWNSLRRVGQATRRALYLRQKMRPKLVGYLYGKWQDFWIARAFRAAKTAGEN